jgi:hypothetical protein
MAESGDEKLVKPVGRDIVRAVTWTVRSAVLAGHSASRTFETINGGSTRLTGG